MQKSISFTFPRLGAAMASGTAGDSEAVASWPTLAPQRGHVDCRIVHVFVELVWNPAADLESKISRKIFLMDFVMIDSTSAAWDLTFPFDYCRRYRLTRLLLYTWICGEYYTYLNVRPPWSPTSFWHWCHLGARRGADGVLGHPEIG